MRGGIIHLHQRKRIHQKHEKYPHPNPRIRFLDHLVMVVAILGPLTTVPQIYKIWVEKNAAGLSAFTWIAYFILTIPLLIYGFVHKDKQLIVMYSLWLVVNIGVTLGILIYG